jgi:chaperonin cofactor prefoldin
MDHDSYQPWRTEPVSDPALTDEADARWQQLLDDSKRAAESLRDLVGHADDRIEIGGVLLKALRAREQDGSKDEVLKRLDALEQRIASLEHRMSNLSKQSPTTLPRAA